MRVLVVYKRNAFQEQLLGRGFHFPLKGAKGPWVRRDLRRIRQAYRAHSVTLKKVREALRRRGVPFRAVYRPRVCDYSPYEGVISVGGDGTFLEAARRATTQWVLGVNSDPARSAGTFCAATGESFDRILGRLLKGRGRIDRLPRLSVSMNGRPLGINVLNDILVTDRKPAAMSRYWLKVGTRQEEQRSSGLWISTAAGSSGAIRSAGGRLLPRSSARLQYRPRELYAAKGFRCRLTGEAVPAGVSVTVGSLMREGLICLDGEHLTLPFRYGDILRVEPARHPLLQVRS